MYVEAIIAGCVTSALTTLLILGSLAHNPRFWLHDAPNDIRQAVQPLDATETRQRRAWAIAVVFSMLVLPFLIALWRNEVHGFSYGEAFIFLLIAGLIFNLIDLILTDWAIIVWWQPEWSRIPGVAYSEIPKAGQYRFHFIAFLKGFAILPALAAITAVPLIWF
jgi:hypothetical protein